MTSIVVISAGLSVPSSTRILADSLGAATAARACPALGQDSEVDVIELRDLAHLITDNQLTGFPTGALADAVRRVAEADAVIAVTPGLHRLLLRACSRCSSTSSRTAPSRASRC